MEEVEGALEVGQLKDDGYPIGVGHMEKVGGVLEVCHVDGLGDPLGVGHMEKVGELDLSLSLETSSRN